MDQPRARAPRGRPFSSAAPAVASLLKLRSTQCRSKEPDPLQFLRVDSQPEVGPEGYDAGADILQKFFEKELKNFLHPDLDPLGKKIITCCLDKGTAKDYEDLLYDVFK